MKSTAVPKELKERYDEIGRRIEEFCEAKLNDEYRQLCLQLCAALCQKRPSPVVSGKSNTWAYGIIHAIGMVNFVFDSSQNPSVSPGGLAEWFGLSASTGSSKSKQIRDLMKMYPLDPKWTLPSRIENNPHVWMIEVDGFIMDIRHCSRALQEEAYRRGMIPYIPEKRGE